MKAIPALLGRYPDMTFYFAGASSDSPIQGKNMENFMKEGLKAHAKAVHFLGFISPGEIRPIIETCDICLIPSLWENFPYVCLEAMAAEKAVIGTNNGGMADMINHGENGLLVPPGSPTAILEAVSYLVQHPEEREAIGIQARKTVLAQYNVDLIGRLTEMFYQTILTI
jgi:glycosyltransferase involved in cell wall biosynthesis